MALWCVEPTDQYNRDFKHYSKKHPEELKAVLDNIDTYLKLLNSCDNPAFISVGFLHNEPDGIKAIDQKGSKSKQKLQQARLYTYAYSDNNILYLLGIGGKTSQGGDIQKYRKYMRSLKQGGQNG